MFKFLKSKKGFTLVELMIVVVIMAILVAVAVPIYSAVTTNARKKTCQANIREITSQVNTFLMGGGDEIVTGTVAFSINSAGVVTDATGITSAEVVNMFQEVPKCPGGGSYTVTTTTAGSAEQSAKISVTCTLFESNDTDHKA